MCSYFVKKIWKSIIFEFEKFYSKMYFSTTLLLLLTSKFTNSMESHEVQSGQMELMELGVQSTLEPLIPFTFPYTDETRLLTKKIMEEFDISITGKMKLILKLRKHDFNSTDDCVVVDGILNDTVCKLKCVQQNIKYIDFMNKHIWVLLRNLFNDHLSYRIKLNTNNSDTGSCINGNQNFVCSYKPNYQIMISSPLMNIFQDLIGTIHTDNDTQITKEYYVTVLIVILKFHPFVAPLYLAYLFQQFVSNFDPLASRQEYLSYNPVENFAQGNYNDNSMVQYTEPLLKLEQKVFRIIMNKILSTSCNLNGIAASYLTKYEYFLWIFAFCFVVTVSTLTIIHPRSH